MKKNYGCILAALILLTACGQKKEDRNGEIDFQMTLEEVYSNSVKCQELSTERTKNELRLEELYEKWGELAE